MTHQFQFTGQLTARDCKRHLPHAFMVNEPVGEITLQLRFAPHRVNDMTNMLTLTLFDPAGFRGAGHRGGSSHTVTLNPAFATPGYRPGPLPSGEWIVQIDTHMIMPGELVHYWLDVTLHPANASPPLAPQQPATQPTTRGPGWYRGDLHSHTNHSDANRPVADLIAAAQAVELDYIFLTDHNTVAGLEELLATAPPDLLTLGGIELTTFWGHALCLGAHEWVDWRVRPGTGAMSAIAEATDAAGQIFIIAHPLAVGDPACTGCAWRYPELMPGVARFVEIWNGPWSCDSNNEVALAFWYDWLNQGLRLTATAGTDTHNNADYAARPGFTVVYAETLSAAGIFGGLRQGQVYLSAGPQLTFSASTTAGQVAQIGDTLTQPATFTLGWAGCAPAAQAQIMVNGRRFAHWPCGEQGEHHWTLAPHEADWCTVEIRDGAGVLEAITNPIFLMQ